MALPGLPESEEQMNVREMVTDWLLANGYGGLYNFELLYDGCACELADLMPCQDTLDDVPPIVQCQPGYRVPCDCSKECAFHIVAEKPEEKPEEKPIQKARTV